MAILAKIVPIILILHILWSCSGSSSGDGSGREAVREEDLELNILMDRSDVVWGFDFLSDGKIIFTERDGSIGILDPASGNVTNVSNVPAVFAQGEGGLLDIRVYPRVSVNPLIYICYVRPEAGVGRNVMARAELVNNRLENLDVIFEANIATASTNHFGCRIEFDASENVFLSLGERGERSHAQDLTTHLGKILRMTDDGEVPADNPFVSNEDAQGEIYSIGHRNVQGLRFRPGTSQLWASELGPVGGDELNLITSGGNYGWPILSNGTDPGGDIEGTSRVGFVDPIEFWTPSISPSAIEFWREELFMANLSGQHIRLLSLDGNNVVEQLELFEDQGRRFRNLRRGPDDFLYFSTDEGELGRIVPVP